MARFPGATWRPVTAGKARPKIQPVRVNLHTAASMAKTLQPYFNQPGIPDSHFYVLQDGSSEQMVDSEVKAYADLEGNSSTISIETQGGATNAEIEKWTAAQCETIAQIVAWAHKTHGVPLRLATNSRPGPSSHGLSWHRLGVDGNFPASGLLAGRVSGGMRYSTARGKVCPGSAKIQQVPSILARAKQIAGSGSAPTPSGPSKAVTAMLNALDYPTVTAAQKDLGLVEDGVAGPLTTEALEAEMSKLDVLATEVDKIKQAVGRMEPIVRALGGVASTGDVDAATIEQIRKRSEQTNAAVGRIEKAIGTYGQAKGA